MYYDYKWDTFQSTVFNVPKQNAEIEPCPAHKWLAYKQEIWLEIFKICGEVENYSETKCNSKK